VAWLFFLGKVGRFEKTYHIYSEISGIKELRNHSRRRSLDIFPQYFGFNYRRTGR